MTRDNLTLPTTTLSTVHAFWRIAIFLLSALAILAILGSMLGMKRETAAMRRRYFRFLARLLGINVVATGKPATERPMLYVCNHISYLDIIPIGSIVEAEFVARADLADWPLFGILAKSGSTVFIDRQRRSTAEARDAMQHRIDHHRALVMFPESTSGNGNHMLRFKSSLFTVAEDAVGEAGISVQPVSIAYTRMNGMPIGVGWRPFFAWYGDMTLMPHLWTILKLSRTTVEIAFHPPVAAADFKNRKELAAYCEKQVGRGFAQLLAGRRVA
jgi:1-acyl-sn-glycerol-3-phosphate acyltransferase